MSGIKTKNKTQKLSKLGFEIKRRITKRNIGETNYYNPDSNNKELSERKAA